MCRHGRCQVVDDFLRLSALVELNTVAAVGRVFVCKADEVDLISYALAFQPHCVNGHGFLVVRNCSNGTLLEACKPKVRQ